MSIGWKIMNEEDKVIIKLILECLALITSHIDGTNFPWENVMRRLADAESLLKLK